MLEQQLTLPVIALRGMAILPGMAVHFDVSREKSVNALEQAMVLDQKIFLVTQRNPEEENPSLDDLYHMGVIAQIKQLIKLQNRVIRVLVEGQERAQLEEFVQEESYLLGRLSLPEQEQEPEDTIKEAMLRVIRDLLMRYSSVNTKLNKETIRQLAETQDLGYMLDQIANNMPLSYEKKQRLLEAYDLSERYEEIAVILNNEIEVFRIRREFQEEVRKRIDQNQKDYSP